MTAHLLALTVGPVQDFIAAARRTRDLWFGSHLLSEISKAAAKAVKDQGGELIFPAPASDADLFPESQFNVANIILAELSQSDPAAVAAEAKRAAQSHWRSYAGQVFDRHRDVIHADIWRDQVDDVIEFYAAWYPYTLETYQSDRAALMQLLAARKRCRDFFAANGRAGVPKSSLDGLRESVLRPSRERPTGSRRPLRLREGEQLDVVGVVKRAWQPESGNPSYPSVARIAADPWIWLLKSNQIDLKPLIEACRALGRDIVHKFDTEGKRGHPQYADFPFEGTLLFRSRHWELRKETEIPDADPKFVEAVRTLDKIARAARDKELPSEPSPYLGVLVADGDSVGMALSRLNSPKEHRQFSQTLAGFAAEARRIVHRHNGILVYAGGDDVLAFVPIDRSLACARELHDRFGETLASWSAKTESKLSLSVGLAVAHFMEPLEDLLDYGRAAEKHAKRARPEDGKQADRDGLAVHVLKRGGGPLTIRANWSKTADEHDLEALDKRLQRLASQLAQRSVPSRLAYDLYEVARVHEGWPDATVKDAIRRDTLSVLTGKEPGGDSAMDDMARLVCERVADSHSLRALADELLVARAVGVARSERGAGAVSP
jgi:CRISPR-associated protein Cmr2